MKIAATRLTRIMAVTALLGISSVAATATGSVHRAYACYGNHVAAADYPGGSTPNVELWYNDCSHWTYVKTWLNNYGGQTEEADLKDSGGTIVATQNNGNPTYTTGTTIQCGHNIFGAGAYLLSNGYVVGNRTPSFTPSC